MSESGVAASSKSSEYSEYSEFSVSWLALREPADAAARAVDLVDLVGSPRVIHDLGCGSGSMGRWLSARLPGPLHWRLYDRDPALLRYAAAHLPKHCLDGSPVTVETREADVAQLTAADLSGGAGSPGSSGALGSAGLLGGPDVAGGAPSLAGGGGFAAGGGLANGAVTGDVPGSRGRASMASLVTASALLDLLTVEEVTSLAAACVQARCPALFTLSVAGRVSFSPADPLDGPIGDAFNAHQRRTVAGRRLLGPDAVAATAEVFARLGAETVVRPSPWRLSRAADGPLIAAWLEGWVTAAVEQDPSLPVGDYVQRHLATENLSVLVEHTDLFVNL